MVIGGQGQFVRRLLHSSSLRSAASVMASESRLSSRRLPVPALRKTLNKYLNSLIPFLREDAEGEGVPWDAEMSKRVQWADDFEKGIGSVLQDRLLGEFTRPLVT